jgi:CelD/BcsL family acetyltransferase involved in cellulose biosynthesis
VPSQVVYLRSLEEFRAAASAWDDLWRRSETTFPTLRAALIAQWVEHFACRANFTALAVEEDGRFITALPLVGRKVARAFRGAALPCNEWSSHGDLLLDTTVDPIAPLDLLFSSLAQLPISLLWLDETLPDTNRWKTFYRASNGRRLKTVLRPRWSVGRVDIGRDWLGYRSNWSRKHRQQMARGIRQLLHYGEIRLALRSDFAPGEAAGWMRRGLEIEDLGWKGAGGSSVLKTPGMEAFFLQQAELLAQEKQLELAFLESAGRPIAFAYGQTAKGVFHSAKIGYDPALAECSPGQLLRYFLLERFFHEAGRKALDFLGPLTESHAAWRPQLYTVARWAAAIRNPAGKMALAAYLCWR